ncbi:hypothetical protein EDB86DRAFT_3076421 [Lactarius hatsudake]|nr:hypothetical protein EDB86DRAFT_3076421 [Lactarius hatsudake]
MVWSNSPYYTPLSPTIWSIIQTLLLGFRLLAAITFPGFGRRLEKVYRRRRHQGMRGATEEFAQVHSQELDTRALLWTFRTLNEDQTLEQFISGIPNFCRSKAIENPRDCLAKLGERGLSVAIISLMHRTLTPDLVSELVKERRIDVCRKAIDAAPFLVSWQTLSRVFRVEEWDGLLGSVDFGHFVMRYIGNPDNDPRTDFCIRCIIAVIIVRLQKSGSHSDLVTLLGISDDLHSLGGRTNVLLANFIFIAQQIVQFHSEYSRDDALFDVSYRTLDELSFDIDLQRASPGRQQEFCSLWNEFVHTARDGADTHVQSISTNILRRIRKSYIAFHGNTDPTIPTAFYESTNDRDSVLFRGSTYPLCSGHLIPLPPAPHRPERTTNASRGTTIASIPPPPITHPAHPVQVTTVPADSRSPVPITTVRSSSAQLHSGTPDLPDPNRSSTARGAHKSVPRRK